MNAQILFGGMSRKKYCINIDFFGVANEIDVIRIKTEIKKPIENINAS